MALSEIAALGHQRDGLRAAHRRAAAEAIITVREELASLRRQRALGKREEARLTLYAPDGGRVLGPLPSPGTILAPGAILMRIVPQDIALRVNGRLPASDVDQVSLGQPARVMFSTFDGAHVPVVNGKVSTIADDVSSDPGTGAAYFGIEITLDPDDVAALGEDVTLRAGIPAEVFIATASQTVAAYLIRPLSDQLQRTWREP